MLLGNIHLDKSEVRIIIQKLTFSLKTEQVLVRIRVQKWFMICKMSSFRGEWKKWVEEFWMLKSS
jgi:hypothetical protein